MTVSAQTICALLLLVHGERDDELVAELRHVAAALDPVPEHVVEAARAAHDWRTIDAEIGALLDGSG